MKLQHLVSRLIVGMIIILIGCTPAATETPTEAGPVDATSTTAPSATATLTTVPTATLAMEVGSTYYYIDGTTLVAVPAGEFTMGANDASHIVSISDYWIYSTKVTNQQYALCVELGKCTSSDLENNPNYTEKSRANDPVVGVTYDQAAAYCSFVNGRLPTEAEWEKAAGNPNGTQYPWGDTAPTCDLVNFNNCVGSTNNVIEYTEGTSSYGGFDFLGNAFEWVADWYDADYYVNSPQENPTGPATGTARSLRSSSFSSTADQISIQSRASEDPSNHRPDIGFRCVVEDPLSVAPFCKTPLIYESAAQSTDACPVIEISQAPYCVGKLPMTNIKFDGPSSAIIDASTCIPSEDPALFTCQSPGTKVSMTASCQVDLNGDSLCPDGYSLQGNQCVANGNMGQCLAGTYDANNQCCTTETSADVLSPAQICPAGSFYSESKNACLKQPVQELVTVTEEVLFVACTGGGNGGDDGEQNSCEPQACGQDEDWVTDLCCCAFFYDHTQCVP